jgi:hypothetical protein
MGRSGDHECDGPSDHGGKLTFTVAVLGPQPQRQPGVLPTGRNLGSATSIVWLTLIM